MNHEYAIAYTILTLHSLHSLKTGSKFNSKTAVVQRNDSNRTAVCNDEMIFTCSKRSLKILRSRHFVDRIKDLEFIIGFQSSFCQSIFCSLDQVF